MSILVTMNVDDPYTEDLLIYLEEHYGSNTAQNVVASKSGHGLVPFRTE